MSPTEIIKLSFQVVKRPIAGFTLLRLYIFFYQFQNTVPIQTHALALVILKILN